MNDLDTHDPLHLIIRDALLHDATDAPRLPTEWVGPGYVTVAASTPRRSGWSRAIVGAAAAIGLIATLALIKRPDSDAPASAPTTWLPEGIEFPSTDLGAATAVFNGPVVADLSRAVGIDGHPPQIIATSLQYMGKETATVWMCTSENGSSGCRPEWNTSTWSTSVTSSADNGEAGYDLWTIEGLPTSTDFVTYADGDQQLWQRPVAGFAAFPNVPGRAEVVIAYDASGNELGRFGSEREVADGFSGPVPPVADLSKADFARIADLTNDEIRTCLSSNGGVFNDGDVATFADDIDQDAVWNQCVTTVKGIVRTAVADIDPRFYDPATERPLNADPALVTSD